MRHALVTGGAGFIGSHLVDKLLEEGWKVTVIDNFDPFYSVEIKKSNINPHLNNKNYKLIEKDIRDIEGLNASLDDEYDLIVHLAARAGVRPSIDDPVGYQDVNVKGTQNMLELARKLDIKHFVFASSSSVYGISPHIPWREDNHILEPISPYAATKVAGELLGHVYSHLYDIRFVALRFFTVYGPRQRPDLAIHKFTKLIIEDKPIPMFGDGDTMRDYTYIDDIIDGIRSAIKYSKTKYEIINLGNNRTVSLKELINAIEDTVGKKAKITNFLSQPGDVPTTYADVEKAKILLGYSPKTDILTGLSLFHRWLTETKKD